MRIGMLAVAGALIATIAGCGNPLQSFAPGSGGGPRLAKADPHKCDQAGDECRLVMVNPVEATWVKDPIVIYGRRDRKITFKLVEGYEFVHGEGIVVSDDPEPKKFDCQPQGNDRYKCTYTNRDKFGMHKYTIKVKPTGGAPLPPYDPYFVNE